MISGNGGGNRINAHQYWSCNTDELEISHLAFDAGVFSCGVSLKCGVDSMEVPFDICPSKVPQTPIPVIFLFIISSSYMSRVGLARKAYGRLYLWCPPDEKMARLQWAPKSSPLILLVPGPSPGQPSFLTLTKLNLRRRPYQRPTNIDRPNSRSNDLRHATFHGGLIIYCTTTPTLGASHRASRSSYFT